MRFSQTTHLEFILNLGFFKLIHNLITLFPIFYLTLSFNLTLTIYNYHAICAETYMSRIPNRVSLQPFLRSPKAKRSVPSSPSCVNSCPTRTPKLCTSRPSKSSATLCAATGTPNSARSAKRCVIKLSA